MKRYPKATETKHRIVTLRVSEPIYRDLVARAKSKKVSLNRLVINSIEAEGKRERIAALQDGFLKLAKGANGDVRYAAAAQAEVIRQDEG